MFVFLFKQKTAYDMRISDWSSDVCSSDLPQSSAITHPNSKDLLRGLRLSEGLLLALELQDLSSPPAPSALFHDLRCGQAVIRRRHFSRKIKTEPLPHRSEEHTSELQSLMRISYAVFCLKKKKTIKNNINH